MEYVKACPKTLTEIRRESERLKCKNDTYGNSQYMCLPNEEKSSLIQFCYEGKMGIELKGSCLEVFGGKQINRYSCSRFSHGCPDADFYKYNVHKYPTCQEINTQRRCYVADPSCFYQITNNSNTHSEVVNGIAIVLGVAIVIALIITAARCIYRRRTKLNPKNAKAKDNLPLMEAELEHAGISGSPTSKNPENAVHFCGGDMGDLKLQRDHDLEHCRLKKDNNELELKFKASTVTQTKDQKKNQPDSENEEKRIAEKPESKKTMSVATVDGEEQRMVKTPEGKEKRIAEKIEGEKTLIVATVDGEEPTIRKDKIQEGKEPRMVEMDLEKAWIVKTADGEERIKIEKEGRIYTYKLLFDEDQEVPTRNDKVKEPPKKEKQAPRNTTHTSEIVKNKMIA